MHFIPIGQITESNLRALVSEGRREDAQLEFKSTLPSGSDEGKKEFLKDVTAMANSQGGDLIYGIAEDRSNPEDAGKAVELVGITGVNADATKLWMSELLNSSVEERLMGIEIREINLSSGGFALVLRVPGGVKGVAYGGVFEALEQRQITPEIEAVAGTSAGDHDCPQFLCREIPQGHDDDQLREV